METAGVTGVGVPALTVSDMERALTFYRDLLGLSVVDVKGAGSAWGATELSRWHAYHELVCGIPGGRIQAVVLRAPDGTEFELIEYVEPKRGGARRPITEPGVAIVTFVCKQSAVLVDRLRQAGIEVREPVPYVLDGVSSRTTYLRDPDGNPLCLFELVDDTP